MDPDDPTPAESTWGSSAPSPLLVAASLAFVQGLLVLVGAATEALSIDGQRVALGLTTTLFFTICGAGLLLCAWGLQHVRPWARGPVLLAQLVSLALAWTFRDYRVVAAVVAVVAVVVLVGLLHPRSIEALEQARDQE